MILFTVTESNSLLFVYVEYLLEPMYKYINVCNYWGCFYYIFPLSEIGSC